MEEVLARLDELADAYDLDAVEREALVALRRAAPEHAPDLWRYVAWARFERGDLEEAIEAAREGDDSLYEAKANFHLWRMEEAAEALARFEGEGEDEAEAEWYRGLVAEFHGHDGSVHYRQAADLAPDLYQEPVRLSEAEIDEVMRAAVVALPPEIAQVVSETVIEVRDLPSPQPDVDPLSLGLYVGRDKLEQSHLDGPDLPPRIEIYQENIQRIARDRDEAIEELRITLLHEIGHHLGFDERRLEELGYG